MRSYLNRLNASVDPSVKQPDLVVQRWAQAIAWCCLETTYRPAAATREAALKLLESELDGEGEDAELQPADCLTYLEQRLRLIQTLEPGDKLRLTLDPLAEYLAGLYVVANCGNWPEFLDAVANRLNQTIEDPASIRGFLLAVRDCCFAQRGNGEILDFVPDALAKLAGLDPAALEQARRQLRVRRLANNLVLPDAADRAYAAGELAKLGQEASAAIPALKKRLDRSDEELAVRRQVLQTLVAVGWEAEQCFKLLENEQETLSLRCLAAGLLKQQTGLDRPVPDPIVEWRDGEQLLRLEFIPVEVEDLGEGVTLELMQIPSGSFVMGSPNNELGSRSNERPQRCVNMEPFWMGRYPITQSQWRIVAGWELVERHLDPEPSTFKGDRLPVESISWHSAVEFCARLSRQTGRDYRLPSEAEWEYACRAGTTTAYHVGEQLTSDFANIDRVVNQTTPVGLFGVANNWGLYDMHGNVLDRCADPWHKSYQGAPEDSHVWIELADTDHYIIRGGSWYNSVRDCRSAYRDYVNPNYIYSIIGLRVLCGSEIIK